MLCYINNNNLNHKKSTAESESKRSGTTEILHTKNRGDAVFLQSIVGSSSLYSAHDIPRYEIGQNHGIAKTPTSTQFINSYLNCRPDSAVGNASPVRALCLRFESQWPQLGKHTFTKY